MRRLSRTPGPVALYLAVLVAPLLFLGALWVFTGDELDELDVRPEPVVVAATEREVRDRQNAQATFEWEAGEVVRAPAWQGIVTAVYVAPGNTVASGDRVLAIDGVDRVAWHSAAPFHRVLTPGQTAPEVAMLYDAMRELGYFEGEPSNPEFYSFALSLAVRDFESDLGVSPTTGNFDPGLLAWLPVEELTLGRVDLETGATAPATGTVIAEGAPRLLGASLASLSPAEQLRFDPGVEYVSLVRERAFAVDADASAISATELPALAALLDPGEESAGAPVERAVVLNTLAVPATSVVSNARGDLCVWVAGTDEYEARVVVPGASRAGVTNIMDGLEATDMVLANPGEVLERPGCP